MRAMPTTLRVRLLIAAVFAALSVTASGQAPAAVTVFEGARVIVGDGRAPIENASFVVSGARIHAGRPRRLTCACPPGRRASTLPARP